MTGLNLDAPEWSVWTPISGGLATIKDREMPADAEDADAGLPIMATNSRGEFIRCEVIGWWFRCNWAGQPLSEDDPETAPMPGVLKLRVQLTDTITYTIICAPVLVWNMPNTGVPYKKIISVYEWPDGTKKICDTWQLPSSARVTGTKDVMAGTDGNR